MIEYTTNTNINLNKGKKILVFSTKWCPDCIYLDNFISEIVEENKEYEFVYINTDDHPQMAQQYDVFGIPSFVAKNDGEVLSTLISKDRKTKSLINSWIKTIGIL